MGAQEHKELEQSYDDVPYESHTYPTTHPSNTAMVAKLFGMQPPDFRKARILELGCSGGGNLSPVALAYPNSQCLGVDFSQEEINEANALKSFAKLNNTEFLRQDILTFDLAKYKESFDYIICHGVFSWVPPPVAAKILQICGACLKPDGIAVVSYNALPGWNAVRSIREMLMHHASRFKTPEEKIRECRKFLDFLGENGSQSSGFRQALNDERALLKDLPDFYFFHDHLSGENFQFYFRDFMKMASAQGLAYIGDAVLQHMFHETQPPEVIKMLKTFDNIVEQEQYLDYVTNRRFRATLLCRNAKKLNRALSDKQLLDFYLAPNMRAQGNTDPAKPVTFVSGKSQFVSENAMTNALFLELISGGAKPAAASDIVARVQKKLGLSDPQPLRDALVRGGLSLVMRGFINLHADSPPCATVLPAKPVASPIARYQARKKNCNHVANLLGVEVRKEQVTNIILQQLDGTKTLPEAAHVLATTILNGFLTISEGDKPVTGDANIRAASDSLTQQVAARLLADCLIMA